MILTEQNKKAVIDLYFNQNKTIRQICKERRMSPRDAVSIIKEEEKKRYTETTALDNNNHTNGDKTYEKQGLQQKSTNRSRPLRLIDCAKQTLAYRLFSKGKNAVYVAVQLGLREPEVTQYLREYWKLKGLSELNWIYKEMNGDVRPIVKLYKLMIGTGAAVEELVQAVVMLRHLDDMKRAYEMRERQLRNLENQIEIKRHLEYLNSTATASS